MTAVSKTPTIRGGSPFTYATRSSGAYVNRPEGGKGA